MKFFLSIAKVIDAINTRIGKLVTWLTLIVVLVSASNAVIRKVFSMSSNAWLELQWYLFGAIFLLAAGYTFLLNEHVRVDALSQKFPRRVQIYIEILGVVFFLFPACMLIFWLSLPFFYESLVLHELSSNTGGLIRWPVKLLIPIGFFLLILAGFSHLIKCIGFLRGDCPDPQALPVGKTAEEALAEEILAQAQLDAERSTHNNATGKGR
ncbi:TRAP transporter small permease subunit [Pollutimonas harenae]|uniref:TRAP transporter small permease protein n=1 Tax=Pollutimonas harenae TaxID=657015 RepID=A0A853GS07_9BURK|nr:TRAP transporter small permease subunit [Pollutimonas harenae]NYT85878.1 TRAP transporter small permease subunit [Pollutimonas harenae]TEA70934.1 TRAP transporter small permease subunit [Pollutimonas harenae]